MLFKYHGIGRQREFVTSLVKLYNVVHGSDKLICIPWILHEMVAQKLVCTRVYTEIGNLIYFRHLFRSTAVKIIPETTATFTRAQRVLSNYPS